ncbi:hypothetical protein [Virgisporangium aliadipatigenens]|nr:hypothetical protein [Virgisporangium aliadipatigenens]
MDVPLPGARARAERAAELRRQLTTADAAAEPEPWWSLAFRQ